MRQYMLRCLLVATFVGAAPAARGQQLQLPDLSRLNAGAVDVVDVTVDQALLGVAASFMGAGGTDDAQVKSLISSLKGIYVKSFTYDKDGAYDPTVLDGVRRQLSTGQWQRIVAARSEKDRSDVAVYLWRAGGGKPGGLAVLSAGPREVTLVNIVGMIDLEQLRSLQGKFGVPTFELGDGPRAAPPKPKDD